MKNILKSILDNQSVMLNSRQLCTEVEPSVAHQIFKKNDILTKFICAKYQLLKSYSIIRVKFSQTFDRKTVYNNIEQSFSTIFNSKLTFIDLK